MVTGDQRNLKSNVREDGITMQYTVNEVVWRENQYEVLYEVSDDKGKLIVGGLRVPVGKELPDEEALAKLFETKILPELEASQNQVVATPEQIYTKSEVESLMIEKGYLQPTEKIEDLKPLSELTAVAVEVVK